MFEKYYVVRIPSYDMKGDLTSVSSYQNDLAGALVICAFNLSHFSIRDGNSNSADGKDQYFAEITYLRVLVPPPPTPVTSRKRSLVPAFDPEPPRPTNKTTGRLWG